MQYKKIAVSFATAVALVAVSACGSSQSEMPPSKSPTTTSAPSGTDMGPTDTQAHNEADVAFATGMIPHHQQAVEMSDMVLAKEGVDPRVVSLAEKIKAAQAPEIETMRGWLNTWGVAASPPMGSGMPGHDMSDHGSMPGMAEHGMMSQEDMAELQDAQGAQASRLFLDQMIQHHNGAISMAQNEIENGQYARAVDMARVIVSSQQEEIRSMEQLLQSL